MEKKNQIPKYPHLRFPEFTDEWKEVTLGEVLSFETGYPFSSDAFNEEGNGVRLIKNRDLKADDRVVFYGGEYDAQYIVQNGDILIGMDGDFSPCLWKKGKALLNQRVGRVNVNRNTSRVFILYVLIDSLKKVELKTSSTTVKHLSHKDVEKIKASLPSFPEQRKIAALLSLIDERIEVQNAIIKEQEVAKTSLIRRLFDRTLRFPEFTDEWKVVKLGEVGEKQHAKNADDSIDRVYTNSAQDGIVEQTEFFDKEIANGNNLSGYYIVKQYDFVYNPRLSKTAPVGAMNLNKNTGIGLVSPLYTVFRITARSVLNEFLEYLFESTSWHGYMNEVANFGARSDRMNIKDKDFFNLPLRLPSLLEQRKIADLLSAVDERIAVEKEYATLLQKQKAYLLRQMFV